MHPTTSLFPILFLLHLVAATPLVFHTEYNGIVQSFTCVASGFGNRLLRQHAFNYTLTNVNKAVDGCDPIDGAGIGDGVILPRGGCNFMTKVHNAEQAGAKFVVVVSDDTSAFSMPASSTNPLPVDIPSCMITHQDGERLQQISSQHNVDGGKSIAITVLESPGLTLLSPDRGGRVYHYHDTIDIKWTSTHNIPMKVVVQQGHSSTARESWVVGNVDSLEGFVPGTFQHVKKTHFSWSVGTGSPTPSPMCFQYTQQTDCVSDTDRGCVWDETSTECQEPQEYEESLLEYEKEYYYEYEFVDGETPVSHLAWTIPAELPADRFYIIRIMPLHHPNLSVDSAYFTIKGRSSLSLVAPGFRRQEKLVLGQHYLAQWETRVDDSDAVTDMSHVELMLYSYDIRQPTAKLIREAVLTPNPVQNTGSYNFTVPTTLDPHTRYYVRIQTADQSAFDICNYYFSIVKSAITLQSLRDNTETYIVGQQVPIRWSSVGQLDNVNIVMYQSQSVTYTIASGVPNTGEYMWLVTSRIPKGNGFKLMVQDGDNIEDFDKSAAVFSVRPSRRDIILNYPAKTDGKQFYSGESITISWSLSGDFEDGDRLNMIMTDSSGYETYIGRRLLVHELEHMWQIPETLFSEQSGATEDIRIRIVDETDGIITQAIALRVHKSAITAEPLQDVVGQNFDTRVSVQSWVHPKERTFNVAWRHAGYMDNVFVYFLCRSDQLPEGSAIRINVKHNGRSVVEHSSLSLEDHFARFHIDTTYAKHFSIRGWLPHSIYHQHEQGDELKNSEDFAPDDMSYQCEAVVENAELPFVRDVLHHIRLEKPNTKDHWVEEAKVAEVIQTIGEWQELRNNENMAIFYYNKHTQQGQYEPPAIFHLDDEENNAPNDEEPAGITDASVFGILLIVVSVGGSIGVCTYYCCKKPCGSTQPVRKRISLMRNLLDPRRGSAFTLNEQGREVQMSNTTWNQDWTTVQMESQFPNSPRVNGLPDPPEMPIGSPIRSPQNLTLI